MTTTSKPGSATSRIRQGLADGKRLSAAELAVATELLPERVRFALRYLRLGGVVRRAGHRRDAVTGRPCILWALAAPRPERPRPPTSRQRRVLQALQHAGGPLTRTELAARTRIAIGNVDGVVKGLLAGGLVVAAAPRDRAEGAIGPRLLRTFVLPPRATTTAPPMAGVTSLCTYRKVRRVAELRDLDLVRYVVSNVGEAVHLLPLLDAPTRERVQVVLAELIASHGFDRVALASLGGPSR